MSLYLIDAGHTLNGGDTGAEGNYKKEQNCTREIASYLKQFLEEKNNQAIFVHCDSANTENSSLNYRINKANQYKNAKLYISIHMNSSDNKQANGTEVYVYKRGGQAEVYAERVVKKIANLGYSNRGVRIANFKVLRSTEAPAILVECCFISNSEDMNKYNAKLIAKAIAEGVLNENISNDIPVEKPNIDNSNSSNSELRSGDLCTTKNINTLLNVRSIGSLSGHIVTTIKKGETFIYKWVDSNYLGWCYIEFNGVSGYVSAEYVQKATSTYNGQVINVSSSLNVRNKPSGKIIGSLNPSEKVKIIATENNYYYVAYDTSQGALSKKGYVSSKYIKRI